MTIRDFSGRCHSAVSRIRGVIDPRHALALGVLLLMLTAIVISSVTAADSPDEDVVLIEDFDDDSTPDVLIADPSGEFGDYSSPGEVEMMLSGGFDEFDNIIFRGETAGDQFGKDVAAADLTGNGLLDLIVGAPYAEVERSDGTIVTDGAAYIFYSPYQTDENGVLYARDADMRVESFFGDADERFGSRVAPLFDITGNGRPEIRTLSYANEDFIDFLGGEQITHIFDGETGEFMFAFVTDPNIFDPWQPFGGDVNGDGYVGQDDIDIIMANMGMSGPGVTRFDGDLNGDGVVDAIDLAIAMDNFGFYQFDIVWDGSGTPEVFSDVGEPLTAYLLIDPSDTDPNDPPPIDCFGNPFGMCCCPCEGHPCGCPSCGGGGGPGTGDPCIDEDPCSPNCPTAECDPACGANPTCNPDCGGNPECNPECEGSDPCHEDCEDHGGGPCGENCDDRVCNPDCDGSDPCAPGCEGQGGGPCGENCDQRYCDPECDDYDECHANCEPECNPNCGGDPCAVDCEKRFCNPTCDDYDECHANCDPECNPNCDEYDPCDPNCDPPCQSLADCAEEEDQTTILCHDPDEIVNFCAPDCPPTCEDDCQPTDWTWSGNGVEFPSGNIGDCVDVLFEQPGEYTLTAENECCTWSHDVIVVGVQITGPAQTTEGEDSDAFDANVSPSNVSVDAYLWQAEWQPNVGHTPGVNFDGPIAQSTRILKATWYADPDSRWATYTGDPQNPPTGHSSVYDISVSVHIGGKTCESEPVQWTVSAEPWGEIEVLAPGNPWPPFGGENTIENSEKPRNLC